MRPPTDRERVIKLQLSRFYLTELLKILWKYRISFTSFISYVAKLTITGDPRMHDILKETTKVKAEIALKNNVIHYDEDSLYELIQKKKEISSTSKVIKIDEKNVTSTIVSNKGEDKEDKKEG